MAELTPLPDDAPPERLLTAPDLDTVAALWEALPVKPGGVEPATVQAADASGLRLSLDEGGAEVVVPAADLPALPPKPGTACAVYIERVDDDGVIHGSLSKADRLSLWDQIEEAVSVGVELEGEVIAVSGDGVSVDLMGLKAVCARRQLGLSAGERPETLIGQRLPFRITRFDARKGNLTLSRTAVGAGEVELEDEPLAEGQVRSGVVKSVTHFGAFVRLGPGVEGLLPVSELSWTRVGHPRELLAAGDRIQVMVLSFDPEQKKVRLGLKQLSEDPWSQADEKYGPGARITGRVLSLTDFGAFVELEPGVEGLVHKSELSWTRRINHPKEILSVGDRVELVVLRLDAGERKLGLSLRQTTEDPYAALHGQFPPGTRLKGRISSVTEFGVFVALAEGIDGLVHKSDLSWGEAEDPRGRFQIGQTLEVMVLEIDADRQRISLGVKQLGPDEDTARFEALEVGAELPVTVARVVDFGAFAALESGLEGLIHRSELAAPGVEDAREALQAGQRLVARVLSVEPLRRRISLSLRGVEQPPEAPAASAPEAPEPAGIGAFPTSVNDQITDSVTGGAPAPVETSEAPVETPAPIEAPAPVEAPAPIEAPTPAAPAPPADPPPAAEQPRLTGPLLGGGLLGGKSLSGGGLLSGKSPLGGGLSGGLSGGGLLGGKSPLSGGLSGERPSVASLEDRLAALVQALPPKVQKPADEPDTE